MSLIVPDKLEMQLSLCFDSRSRVGCRGFLPRFAFLPYPSCHLGILNLSSGFSHHQENLSCLLTAACFCVINVLCLLRGWQWGLGVGVSARGLGWWGKGVSCETRTRVSAKTTPLFDSAPQHLVSCKVREELIVVGKVGDACVVQDT